MRNLRTEAVAEIAHGRIWPVALQRPMWSSRLNLVTAHELEGLRVELAKGRVPSDLEAKLNKLAAGSLSHRFIEQHCQTIIGLLLASEEGSFMGASRAERDRLLRVLAYVRKDDDAIPDYRPDGFTDDQEEMRAVTIELKPLVGSFKAWRLQHQVPAFWMRERR